MEKLILVTGASRGIGSAILENLIGQVDGTFVGTATSQKGLDSINDLLKRTGATGQAMLWNALEKDSADGLVSEIKRQYGIAPNILINNAGITRDQLLLRMKSADWDDVIQANLTACFHLTQICCKSMLRARWGRIVNMSSVAAVTGNPGQTNYAAAKAGMIAFSKSLAMEVASRHITVNCVCPGFIDTEMLDGLTDDRKKSVYDLIPMGRFGTTDEIAHAVSFLVSDLSAYITGSCLHVNGGLVML